MRKKPAACSNALGPRPGTSCSCARAPNAPCSSRYSTIFFASDLPMPATYESSCALAVPSSTPTWLTQLSTTSPSFLASSGWCTSCWYWPTPIAFGSILTSSASGSCRRRALEIARAVHARARLADLHGEHVVHAGLDQQLAHERLGLAAAGAVADRDR